MIAILSDPEKVLLATISAIVGFALRALYEWIKDNRAKKTEKLRISTALFHELCDRAARCSYDYGFPFSKYAYPKTHTNRKLDDIVKFNPASPLVFPAVIDKLGIYPATVGANLMVFYSALERWRQELELTTKVFHPTSDLPDGYMQRLSRRLGETLEPAVNALDALAPLVPNSGLIESRYFNAYFTQDAVSQLQREQVDLTGSLKTFLKLAAESKKAERQTQINR